MVILRCSRNCPMPFPISKNMSYHFLIENMQISASTQGLQQIREKPPDSESQSLFHLFDSLEMFVSANIHSQPTPKTLNGVEFRRMGLSLKAFFSPQRRICPSLTRQNYPKQPRFTPVYRVSSSPIPPFIAFFPPLNAPLP